jgi:hypothetical protein
MKREFTGIWSDKRQGLAEEIEADSNVPLSGKTSTMITPRQGAFLFH